MSIQGEIDRITNNVQTTLNTIADTGVEVGAGSDALPAAAAALANEKADVNHTHSYNDLTNKPTIPSALSQLTTDSTHRTVTDTEKSTWNAKSDFSGSYNDLTNKPTIPAAYSHPTYTAKTNGLYKVTVDGTGHVSGTAAVSKSDITGLGIPAQDTTYSAATQSAAGLLSADDKKKLDGIASGANAYTHPSTHAAGMITGLATVATSGSYNDLSNKPTIPSAYSHPSTHSASMISSGTFTGAVYANSSGQTYSTSLLRNTKLVSADTNPTVNGEINWTYK